MLTRTDLNGLPAVRAVAQLLVDPLAATRRLSDDHGPVTYMARPFSDLARRPIVHFVGSTYAEQIFKNYEVFQNGGIILKSAAGSPHNILRNGYFSANGDEYQHYVKLFGPLFRRKIVDDAAPVITSTVTEALDQWQPDDVTDIIPRVNALLKTLASRSLFKDPDVLAGLHAADMVEQHGRLSGISIRSALSDGLRRTGYSRLHNQAKVTYEAIVEWGRTRTGLKPDADVLSTIVNAPTEDGRPASPDRIAGYGWTMLGAAYDTSTSILSWLFVLLATHPAVATRLHAELMDSRIDPRSDMAGLMQLPYLDAVIKEALRLIPPAPIQRRKSISDTEVCGHEIPQGAELLVSAWMTNRDPALYPDPDIFDPSRWEGISRSPYQWLTFSAGPRRCLGIWFAFAFLKTTLANLISRWRIDIPDGSAINMKVAITIRPYPAIPVALLPQDGAFRKSRISGNVHKYLQFVDTPQPTARALDMTG